MRLVLLTGHRKSGTTMLFRLFDGHPDIHVYPPDISLLYAYFPSFAENFSDNDARERIRLVTAMSFERVYRRLPAGSGVDTGAGAEFAGYLSKRLSRSALRDRSAFLGELSTHWIDFNALDPDKPLVLKETSQTLFLPEFMKSSAYSLSSIVLVRDPRDNFAALKAGVEGYYGKLEEGRMETLASLLNRARFDLYEARVISEADPSRVQAVRFEDVVSQTSKTMAGIADFLDIARSDILERPTVFGLPYGGNSHDGVNFEGVSAKNLGKWRDRISPQEAAVIEYWLSEEMAFWGYPLSFDRAARNSAAAWFYDWYNTRYFFSDSFAR